MGSKEKSRCAHDRLSGIFHYMIGFFLQIIVVLQLRGKEDKVGIDATVVSRESRA